MRALLAAAALAYLWPAIAFAAPGDLDPSFGMAGRVILPGSVGWADDVAVGPDGEIVVVGFLSAEGTTQFMVVRLLDDGTPDPSFGMSGVQITPVGSWGIARAVLVQPDGRIVVVGEASVFLEGDTRSTVAVVRYLPDGSLDETFDGDGMAFTWIPGTGESFVSGAELQADGAIVVAGSVLAGEDRFDGYDAFVLRYTPAGAADASFGTGGVVVTTFAPYDDFLRGVRIDSLGRIVIGGNSGIDHINDDIAAHFVFTLARLLTDGSLDPSFGTGGKVTTDVQPSGYAGMLGVVLRDDDTIQAIGSSGRQTEPGPEIIVARYATDGTLELITDTPTGPKVLQLEAVERDADGRILTTGTIFNDGSLFSANVALLRLTPDGELDTGFGSGGVVQHDVAGSVDRGAALTVDAGGRIVVAGRTYDGVSAQQMVVFRHAGGTCADGAACDDGDPCTAGETCTAGACSGSAAPDGTACDDWSVCTSGETCTAGTCGGGTATVCDDCYGCDAYAGCIPAPEPVCAEADESSLEVGRNGSSPLTWKWRGEGPEEASAGMKLCLFEEPELYDNIGYVDLGAHTTDGSSCTRDGCWRGGGRGIRYSSRAEGINRISWHVGPPGRDVVRLRASGPSLWTYGPPPTGVSLLVQLTDVGGGCWQSRSTLRGR